MLIPIKPYRSLASIPNQPYSFSEDDYRGKEADLGPRIYSPLYKGQPIDADSQMFPPVWSYVDALNVDEYSLIVSGWDTASRVKERNDPSNNCIVGRRWVGDFVVLDNWEAKLTFDKLLPVVLERYRLVTNQFKRTPVYLCIEEADAGKALCDVISAQYPQLPLLRAKAVSSKIIRAESVTPFTSAGSVKLFRADWNTQFIADLSNFPASDRDHAVDSFCHGMRAFTGTGSDFQAPKVLPAGEYTDMQELVEQAEAEASWNAEVRILDDEPESWI